MIDLIFLAVDHKPCNLPNDGLDLGWKQFNFIVYQVGKGLIAFVFFIDDVGLIP